MPKYKKTICIDFDGAINSYESGYLPGHELPDPPVGGAIEWLSRLNNSGKYNLAIYSSRSEDKKGRVAMQDYMAQWASMILDEKDFINLIENLKYPLHKPPCIISIDDRVFLFQGEFPSMEYIDNFKPWHKK